MTFLNMQTLFASSMANPISFCSRTKKQRCLPSLMRVFVFLSALNFTFSKASATECTLDFQFPLFNDTDSTTEDENWSGFLPNHCGATFETYLYALANRANRTGQIFLIPEEQKDCLISLQNIDSDASDCGLEKLTGGNGGCSDYNIADVAEKLENRTNNLSEDCDFPDSENYDEICSKCSKGWIEIISSSDNGNAVEKSEAMVCRFAVLVRLTSSRTDDRGWIHNLYQCLGNYSFSSDEEPSLNDGIDVNTSTGLWVLCGGVAGIVVVILIAGWTLWGRKIRPRISGQTKVLRRSSSLSSGCIKMTAQEIHSATNNLDPLNFIGEGVAGKVYKGRLSNGQHVAVKHIINDGQQETFIREVKSLAHIRHPNLVTLIGYYEGKDQYFLVYELCRHRNLSEWLFGKDKNLSWIQRLTIAIDSARGLLFLHSYHEGCIVHRDIKPANILLGANLLAKLSDFGLSKVMNIGQSFVSSEVRGTFGYIDPEYRQNHHVKASGDVYSFGVVLLQLLSGRRVINLNMKRPMTLDKMAKCFSAGNNLTQFADPKLDGDYPVEAFGIVLNLALSCTGLKKQRPSMEEVMLKLEMALQISREGESFTFSTSVMA